MASYREQNPAERLEKRRLFRFPVQLPVKLGRLDDMSSICTNLSTNGASIETSLTLSIGERLSVIVTISPQEEPLRMVGQVIWKREISVTDIDLKKVHEVGVRFLRPLPSLEKQGGDDLPDFRPPDDEEDEFILPSARLTSR